MNLATALSPRVTNFGSYLLHHRHRQAVRVEQRWTPTRIFPSCLLHTGRRHLKRVVQRFPNFALRFCEPARRFYERKKAKTSPVVARKALAHKLARACFHMLKERKPFDMTRCFA
jgi:hypothetical protein